MKVNEKCPGEYVCVNDTIHGECGSRGRTLAQHCHKDVERGGCRLYFTKPGVTPVEFEGMLEAALVCRARQKAGLSLAGHPLPFWAEKAHIVANNVYLQIEAEAMEKDDDVDADGVKGFDKFKITGSGDSGAFALIHQQMQEMQTKRKG